MSIRNQLVSALTKYRRNNSDLQESYTNR
eukprot:UN16593